MNEIQNLQDNLFLIRGAVGWSAEKFGDRIGVTRQTINNLESKRGQLTKTQYIAIRSVLDAEMAAKPQEENDLLRELLEVLVDHPEEYPEEYRQKLKTTAGLLTPSILAGKAKKNDVKNAMVQMMGGALNGLAAVAVAAAAGPVAGVATLTGGFLLSPWLKKVMESQKKKEEEKKKEAKNDEQNA